jgi:hypothetical protein
MSKMQQTTLSDFFLVRKRPLDQHAAKKRKVEVQVQQEQEQKPAEEEEKGQDEVN